MGDKDVDNDGQISRAEMIRLVMEPSSLALLQDLNINVLFLVQLSRVLFPYDSSVVTYDELLHLLLSCRGDTGATVSTLAGGFTYVTKEFSVILKDFEQLKADIKRDFRRILNAPNKRVSGASDVSKDALAP